MNKEDQSVRILPASWVDTHGFAGDFPVPERPLEVDIGCGKGRFLLARAGANPGINYLGIERMLRRVRKVANKVRHQDLNNVRLIRADAYYTVTYLIPDQSVEAYYLFFPDPWPKVRHEKNRLMGSLFMDALVRTLKPNGLLHFATDHLPYFDDVMELLHDDTRFQPIAPFVPEEPEQTDFERWYLDKKPIGRASFMVGRTEPCPNG